MLNSVLGKKIGMTQIFVSSGNVIPVTVVDVANLFVTQVKASEKNGYSALQLGLLKKKYIGQPFSADWLKSKKKYFSFIREVQMEESLLGSVEVGKEIKLEDINFEENNLVNVTGKSRGLGFQGVVKRWGFAGGPSAHGSTFHRKPGSIGNVCSDGKVIKGKKLPGQTGNKRISVKNLKIVRIDKQNNCLFVKGAVPGKKNSVVMVSRQG